MLSRFRFSVIPTKVIKNIDPRSCSVISVIIQFNIMTEKLETNLTEVSKQLIVSC